MILKSKILRTLIISCSFTYSLIAYGFASTENLEKDISLASTASPLGPIGSQEAFESPIAFLAFSCFTGTEQEKVTSFFAQTRDEICKNDPSLINLLDHYSFPNLSDDPRITKGE